MRLRFSIRDLLWLTTVVALAVALWLDHRQLADANKRLSDATRVFSVTFAVPPNSAVGARVLKTLQEAYLDVPGVSMTYDGPTGELQVAATPGELAAIRAAMDVIAQASSTEIAAEQAAANNAVTR